MTRPRKVVFLGFCAGERHLIRQLAQTGRMPAFQFLLNNALIGHSMGLPGLFVGTMWPSFMTGVTPARHGVHSWQQLIPGSYDTYRCKASDHLQREPFWNALSRAGRRVCVMDIPHSGASADVNGVQLVEWGAHDANHGFHTWPPRLADDVVARFGQHPVRGLCDAHRTTEEFVAFRDDLVAGIETKTALTKHFLHQDDWDFFGQVYTEGHCVGHQCWHLHDPRHPRHDADVVGVTGDPVEDVYVAIDRAIGNILREVEKDTTVIVLASHGMGPKFGAQFMLDRILLRLGVAAPATPPQQTPPRMGERLDPYLTWGWQHTPDMARRLLQPARLRLRRWVAGEPKTPPPTIDAAAGDCFMVQNNSAHGGIRVNLKGREPRGKVAAADYDRFLEALASDLKAIVNLETGRPIVKRIIKVRECYRGDRLDDLPDLLVEWRGATPTRAIGSDKIGVIEDVERHCRSGDHKPGGMFAVLGPGISKGRLPHTVSIMDFAPTISAMLGVRLDDVDGRPIAALF